MGEVLHIAHTHIPNRTLTVLKDLLKDLKSMVHQALVVLVYLGVVATISPARLQEQIRNFGNGSRPSMQIDPAP